MEHYPVLGSTRSWGAHLGEIAGVAIVGGIKGFYARHDGLQSSDCDAFYPAVGCLIPNTSIPTNLAIPPKFGRTGPSLGMGSILSSFAERDATSRGLAIEFQKARSHDTWFSLKAGIGLRHLDQSLTLSGKRLDVTPILFGVSSGLSQFARREFPSAFTYVESLRTDYVGGYLGAEGRIPLGNGFALNVDGEIGPYWARSVLSSSYEYTFRHPMTLQAEHAQDALAVVGVARVGLEKDFGGVKIEAYARGETYSYVPRTLYSEDGASIDRGHATAGSFGASIKIPFAGGDSAPH